MSIEFHAPPGWPTPPTGWAPPPGWMPDPAWPPAPEGWQFWSEAPEASAGVSPVPSPAPTPNDRAPGASYGSTAPMRPPAVWPLPNHQSDDRSPGAPHSVLAPELAHPAASADRTRLLAGAGWGGLTVTTL